MTYAPVHRGPAVCISAPHPNRRLRILIKILTLRLCSYINLFSCQISSYGLFSLRRLSGYEPVNGFWFYPCNISVQLKMALNLELLT
jgi:hypothetical protein